MLVFDWLSAVAASGEAFHIRLDLATKKLMFRDVVLIDGGKLMAPSIQMPDGTVVSFTGIMTYDGEPYAEVERLYARCS